MKRGPTVPPAVRRGPVGSRRAPEGPVGTPECPVWVRTSIVHQYGTVERSVEPHRVLSCQNRVPTEIVGNRCGTTEPEVFLAEGILRVYNSLGCANRSCGPSKPRQAKPASSSGPLWWV